MERKSTYTLIRVLIWTALLLMFFGTGTYFLDTIPALLGAALSATILIGTVLANELWLFPKFYSANRNKYIVYNALGVVVIAALYFVIDHYVLLPFHNNTGKKDIPIYFPIIRSLSVVLLGDFISISLLLAKALKEKADHEKELKEEKLGTEIKLLKAQINPHFIFNALNNIYSLTYIKSKNAPDSVLKLSEMLRYVFYDCSEDQVKLEKEIDYIRNFIAFQQMKSEHVQNIVFETDISIGNQHISPMLFIPFIENAFKYSNIESHKTATVTIRLFATNKRLDFSTQNTIPEAGKIPSGNGTGIKNVKKRLDILYSNKYELDIIEKENSYFVSLKIDLS